ncbi:Gustatory receptor [Trinorchestia longiramus]|nr:Gustatory receptor [Trinorchestia longiramus]
MGEVEPVGTASASVQPVHTKHWIMQDFWIQSPVRRAVPEENDYMLCLRPLIKVARAFGVLPISFKDNKMRFRWLSLLTAYALLVTCILCIYVILLTYISVTRPDNSSTDGSSEQQLSLVDEDSQRNASVEVQEELQNTKNSVNASTPKNEAKLKGGNVLETVQSGSFLYFSLSGSLLLLKAAPMLVGLCERWCVVENGLGSDVSFGPRWPLFLALILMGLSATGENIMSMIYAQTDLPPFWQFLKMHTAIGYPKLGMAAEYSRFLGLLLLVINKYATFIWNFVDVFIGAIAYILTRHFKAFNRKLQKCIQSRDRTNAMWWRGMREQHFAMQGLVEATDAVTGPLLLQSYMCNLYFMLMQLYNTLKPKEQVFLIRSIYLAWSLLHLLCRLLFVSFTCAALHIQTLEPTTLLLSLPTESVNIEVDRFMQQIQVRQVGLTGWGFFFVNKNFILAVRMCGVCATFWR